jgi:hypothetical protein
MNPSDPTLEEARFWARVDKSGECWLWTGPRDKDGYGKANGEATWQEIVARAATPADETKPTTAAGRARSAAKAAVAKARGEEPARTEPAPEITDDGEVIPSQAELDARAKGGAA